MMSTHAICGSSPLSTVNRWTSKCITMIPWTPVSIWGEYQDVAEWEILMNTSRRVPKPKDEGVMLMFSRRVSLQFTLTMKRRPGFKSFFLTLPCVVLSLLTTVIFGLSPERPDRHTLGKTQSKSNYQTIKSRLLLGLDLWNKWPWPYFPCCHRSAVRDMCQTAVPYMSYEKRCW